MKSLIVVRNSGNRSMTYDKQALRDWHRLFGLMLTDFFRDSPFSVEVERDLSARRLAGVSEEQIRQYLDRLTTGWPSRPRKPRRKK